MNNNNRKPTTPPSNNDKGDDPVNDYDTTNFVPSAVTDAISGSVGSYFRHVVSTLSLLFLPNISENIIRQVVVNNLSPEFIKDFNNNMQNPEYRKEVDIAVKNLKEYYDKIVSIIQDPVNKVVDNVAGNIIPKLVGSMARSASTAVFNIANAIPGVGAILSAGRVLNNIGETVGNVTNSISNVSRVVNNAATKMSAGFENLSISNHNVSQRVENSAQEFAETSSIPKPDCSGNEIKLNITIYPTITINICVDPNSAIKDVKDKAKTEYTNMFNSGNRSLFPPVVYPTFPPNNIGEWNLYLNMNDITPLNNDSTVGSNSIKSGTDLYYGPTQEERKKLESKVNPITQNQVQTAQPSQSGVNAVQAQPVQTGPIDLKINVESYGENPVILKQVSPDKPILLIKSDIQLKVRDSLNPSADPKFFENWNLYNGDNLLNDDTAISSINIQELTYKPNKISLKIILDKEFASVNIEVSPLTTIRDVKSVINDELFNKKKIKIPDPYSKPKWNLYFGYTKLEDSKRLYDYKIKNNTELRYNPETTFGKHTLTTTAKNIRNFASNTTRKIRNAPTAIKNRYNELKSQGQANAQEAFQRATQPFQSTFDAINKATGTYTIKIRFPSYIDDEGNPQVINVDVLPSYSIGQVKGIIKRVSKPRNININGDEPLYFRGEKLADNAILSKVGIKDGYMLECYAIPPQQKNKKFVYNNPAAQTPYPPSATPSVAQMPYSNRGGNRYLLAKAKNKQSKHKKRRTKTTTKRRR